MVEYLTKVILDTSIYIPFINAGIAHPVLNLEYKPLFYMSAVVIEELYAGAFDNVSIKLLDRMYETFEGIGRIVVPEASDWQKTGKVIAKLGRKYGFEDRFLLRIQNDILIALSARKIGAVVVTNNKGDFLMIKEFVDFKVYGGV
ncbi:MAG: type II toxin-antitoxin system VapC family toxin [Elusimicrobiota bacterium]